MKTPISEQIKLWAKELGFDAVAFTRAELPAGTDENLDQFLNKNYHGDMA